MENINDVLNYVSKDYDETIYSKEQNIIIKQAIQTFRELVLKNNSLTIQDQDIFIHELLNPEYLPSDMVKILKIKTNILIEVANPINIFFMDNTKRIMMLKEELNLAIKKANRNVSALDNKNVNTIKNIEKIDKKEILKNSVNSYVNMDNFVR